DPRSTHALRLPSRALFLSLFRFAELPPTKGFTENAESESFRRFAFSAFLATTYAASPLGESPPFLPAALAVGRSRPAPFARTLRSEEHTSELQSRENLVCR